MKLPRLFSLFMCVGIASSEAMGQESPISSEVYVMARDAAQNAIGQGLAAEREGRTLQAEALYARAAELDASQLAAHLGLARMLDARGHRTEAQQVVARVPRRAFTSDADAIIYARALASFGSIDDALSVLRNRRESVDVTRALIDLATQSGRFLEALAAARRVNDVPTASDDDARHARVLVRALTRLVGEADAVRAPHTSTAFRRALMGE
jgi:thioredoxin-like negative regulator of GroEL